MKKILFSCVLAVLFLSTANAQYGAQRTGYEGDYFSLEGAIDVFKHSYSIDDFERRLNREDTWVNNLDLNYDGRIDYIRVEHRRQGDFHAIILQVPIDRYEVQDVAVIEIERTGRREAILQIVGDEDLYGEEVIVEPIDDRGYSNSYVNVYNWRPVRYIFNRNYRVYDSPYSWGYYPTYWSPWNQCAWNVFRPRIVVYHTHYHVVHVHRVVHVHNFYKPHRAYSHHVVQHTNQVRVKHGKAPVHREKAQRVNQRDDRQVDNPQTRPSRNTNPNPKSTPADKPKSRNDVVQKPEQRPRTQQTDSKRDVQQSTPPKRRDSTPKANSQQQEKPVSQDRGSNVSRNETRKRDTAPDKASQGNTSRGNTSRNEARKSNSSQSKAAQGNTSGSNTKTTRNQSQKQKPSVSAKKSTPASGNKASGNSSKKTSRKQ